MRRIIPFFLAAVLVLTTTSTPRPADGYDTRLLDTRLTVQVQPTSDFARMSSICEGILSRPCALGNPAFRVTEALTVFPEDAYYVFIVLTTTNIAGWSKEGLSGVQFGLDYDPVDGSGVDVWNWTSCTDLSYQDSGWPGSRTGIRTLWNPADDCQRSGFAVVGYLLVTAQTADRLSLIPWPKDGAFTISTCKNQEVDLPADHLGIAGFGNAKGEDPCFSGKSTVPVDRTTWGTLKALYGR